MSERLREDVLSGNSYFSDLLKIDENLPESLVSEGLEDVSLKADNIELVQTMWYGNSVRLIARVFVENTVRTDKKDTVLKIQSPSLIIDGKTCEGPYKTELIDFNRQANWFVFAIFFYTDAVPKSGDTVRLNLADISFMDEDGTPYKSIADKTIFWNDSKIGKSCIFGGGDETVKFIDLSPFILHIETSDEFTEDGLKVSLVALDGSEIPVLGTYSVTGGPGQPALTWFLEEFVDIGSIKSVKINGKVFETAPPA